MNKDYRTLRKKASLKSKGSSSNEIYHALLSEIDFEPKSILDIGCGQGHLIQLLQEKYPNAEVTGCDLTKFSEMPFNFIEHDLNTDMGANFQKYDLICSLEVIEHIENPRHFIRQISERLNQGAKAILSTPNPYSLLSALTFFLKGHHNAFGPKNYPAHITVMSPYHFKNIISEIDSIQFDNLKYLNNGRIPGSNIKWATFFPFLKGKRFSDNYMIRLKKQ